MEQNKKKMILIVSLIFVAMFGVAFAWFLYYQESDNTKLVGGNIYLNLIDGEDVINITHAFPENATEARDNSLHNTADTKNTLTFTIEGDNDTNKDIYYEIVLNYGDEMASPYQRFKDEHLVFDLIELDTNNNDAEITPYIVSARSYSTLDKPRMYADKVEAGHSISRKFKVRMWISDNIIVSDSYPNHDYTETGSDAFNKHYASVKVGVFGDFNVKSNTELYSLVKADAVIDNVNNAEKFINNATPGINFGAISSDTNGKGVYLRAGTENDDYPIYYYRGAVTNNNVYFAGFCWKIVRTTDTGGVKLIYAGENKGTESAPVCNNTGVDAQLAGTSTFNERYQSPAYVGYMYGDVYEWKNEKEAEGAYFGTGFNYENGVYSLKGAKVGIDTAHHYTCNLTTEEGTCASIRYYYYYNGDYGANHDKYYMYVTLTGGDDIQTAIDKMQKNTNNSTAKNRIDEWYNLNMRSYTNKLEDTIWCNDRGIYQPGGWNASGGVITNVMQYNGVKKYYSTRLPSLECDNKNDAFTVSNNKGNKMLTYPVALITDDEIMLAGGQEAANNSYYLYTGQSYWTLSPWNIWLTSVVAINVSSSGSFNHTDVRVSFGLRPSVSLRPGTVIDKGTGVGDNPYIVS